MNTDLNFIDYFRLSPILLEVVAMILAIATYSSFKKTGARYIIFILILTVLVEILAGIVAFSYKYYENSWLIQRLLIFLPPDFLRMNIWMFNINCVFIFALYLIYYHSLIQYKYDKLIISILAVIFPIVVLSDFYFNFETFNRSLMRGIYIYGALSIFIASNLYFRMVLFSNRIHQILLSLDFWIVLSTCCFYITVTPVFLFAHKLHFTHLTYVVLLTVLNYMHYGLFITGFIINAKTSRNQ